VIGMTEQKASSLRLYGWIAIVVIGLVIGIYGAIKVLVDGHGASTGGTDQIPWGIFVPTYIFFVAASAGCVIVSLGYAIGIKRFELVMRRAVFLAIVAQIAGGLTILLDLGSPFRVYLPLISPNLQSPIWWMGFFYALYLVLLLTDFYFLSKHDIKKTKIISVAAGLCAIAVHSTLGAIFGFAATRTYFGGAIAPIYFILIAIIIGTSLLLLVTTLEYRFSSKQMSPELRSLVMDLGRFLGVALGIAILFILWKDLAGLRSTVETSALAYRYMLTGPGAWWYWTFVVGVGLVLPLTLLIKKGTRNPNGIMLVSLLVLIGMFAARVEFNLGGQLVAQVFNLEQLQTPLTSYSAKFAEIAVVILAFAIAAGVYTWGDRKLSLDKIPGNG
jgi:Ni/Fe-hydrogenase subunit HybB-like protein